MKAGLTTLLFFYLFAVLVIAQQTENSRPPIRVLHVMAAQHGLTLHFTPAYDQAAAHVMLDEANRLGQILKLQEKTPLLETDVAAFLHSPVGFLRSSHLGRLESRNYIYVFLHGTMVTGLAYKELNTSWEAFKKDYTWPVNRLDTNKALGIAAEIMAAAGIDAEQLNRDCDVDIRAPMTEGSHFLPFYYVDWTVRATNEASYRRPESGVPGDFQRPLLPSYNGKMDVAHLTFLEPTRLIGSLHIYDPKYLKSRSSEELDLEKLLTPENPEDLVILEMKAATNTAALRELYIRNGASESLLRKYGWETNTPPRGSNSTVVK